VWLYRLPQLHGECFWVKRIYRLPQLRGEHFSENEKASAAKVSYAIIVNTDTVLPDPVDFKPAYL
jgi:hypothetical protein